MGQTERGFVGAWREGDVIYENWAYQRETIPRIFVLRDWRGLNGDPNNWGLPIVYDDPRGELAKEFGGRPQFRDPRIRPKDGRQEAWFWRDEVLALHRRTGRPFPSSVYE